MPTLSLRFFELQRRDRMPEMRRFQKEFVVQSALLEDIAALREIGDWKGRWAMVPFLYLPIGGHTSTLPFSTNSDVNTRQTRLGA